MTNSHVAIVCLSLLVCATFHAFCSQPHLPHVCLPQSKQLPWFQAYATPLSHFLPLADPLPRTGPFDNVVKQSLRISNHNALPVAFKVKTTAPKVCSHSSIALHRSDGGVSSTIAFVRILAGWSPGKRLKSQVIRQWLASPQSLSDGSPVMLQAMKDEPPLSVKCKDKFLIQSTAITPEKASLPLQEIVRHLLSMTRSRLSSRSGTAKEEKRPRSINKNCVLFTCLLKVKSRRRKRRRANP